MAVRSLRVSLSPALSTALLCIRCGQFRCELAVSVGTSAPVDALFGMHTRCLRDARAETRASKASRRTRMAAIAEQTPERSDVQASRRLLEGLLEKEALQARGVRELRELGTPGRPKVRIPSKPA